MSRLRCFRNVDKIIITKRGIKRQVAPGCGFVMSETTHRLMWADVRDASYETGIFDCFTYGTVEIDHARGPPIRFRGHAADVKAIADAVRSGGHALEGRMGRHHEEHWDDE